MSAGGVNSNGTVSSGATEVLAAGGTQTGLVNVENGGTLSGAGGTVLGTANITGFGQNLTVAGSGGSTDYIYVFSGGSTTATVVSNGGQEVIRGGGSSLSATVSSGGTQWISGTANNATILAGGAQIISTGGVANATTLSSGGGEYVSSGGVASGTTVSSGATELIYEGGLADGTTLQSGGNIDVAYFAYTSDGSANLDASTDTLTVSDGARIYTQQLAGNYAGRYFHMQNDTAGGTLITQDGTPCYCPGTAVLTEQGEIAVELLKIGDLLVTHSGSLRPIMWIGRRSYSGKFAAGNRDVLPVRIKQGALADCVPRRDLWVSPLHAMYLDEVLIPAVALVNGTSIVQAEAVDRVDYIHVELETHDVILNEGAPSETFVDDDSRGMFHNAAEYRMLYPDAARVPARYCAPRVEEGEALEAVRHRLAARAGNAAVSPATSGELQGHLDDVSRDRIRGWARDAASPDTPVLLRISDNDVVIGEVLADRYRADLERAAIGDGRHGFELAVPGGLSPMMRHVIRVERAADRRPLERSPWVVEASPAAASAPPRVTTIIRPDNTCRGHLDMATRERITGWAQGGTDVPVALQVIDNGVVIASVLANRHRADLEQAGIGTGRHGFDVLIPGGLSPLTRHTIQVTRESDGAELPGSPTVIEAVGTFEPALEQAVANSIASLEVADEQARSLSFIMAQADRLLQRRADTESRRTERTTHQQFRRRWGPQADAAGVPDPGLRALVVDVRVPVLGRDAGSQAILSHMRALQRLGYGVSFVAAEEMASEDTAALEASGIACCRAPFYAAVEEVLRRQADCFDVIYLHRAAIATRYLGLARRYGPRARILYSVADLHHVRLDRQAAVEERPELLAASRRQQLEEFTAAWSTDAVITHSLTEAELLRRAVPEARVHRVPWDVPVRDCAVGFAARRGIAFIGGYGHMPNVDAARWLAEAVMPLVWRISPAIGCMLVGSDMPEGVRRLARPGLVTVGQIDDLGAGVLDRVRLTVAPLRYGAGVKGKVLDSFAAGVPCVMSEVAAEGIGLSPALLDLVGHDAIALASLICRLHDDEAAHRTAAVAGFALIEQTFSADAVADALQSAIEGRSAVRPGPERKRTAAA